jgi:xylulose-5-phosphate/fructose-6-phosphate phosphoketolase
MADERLRHRAYTREHGADPADITEWRWPYVEQAPRHPGSSG